MVVKIPKDLLAKWPTKLCTKRCPMNCGNFFMQNAVCSPSANILKEAEADGPMKSTQNQDHRSHTTKYVKLIFVKIFGPKNEQHIYG